MKILVTGAGGQLGHDIIERLNLRGISCVGVDKDDFDLCDREAAEEFILRQKPDAVIHCAAYTAVDKAEDEQEICRSINERGTANILSAVKKLGAKMMYISTDYVFDGKGSEAFETDSPRAPSNYYGMSKYLGEEAVKGYDKLFVVRISWVFGVNGRNFIRTMLRLSENHEEVGVVADQIGSPTYTYDLSKLLCDMIVSEKYGVYHATNEGYCSWAELAEYVFACAGKATRVKHLTSDEYPSKAKRPKNSRLDKSSLDKNGFDRLPTWQDAVKRFVDILMGENAE